MARGAKSSEKSPGASRRPTLPYAGQCKSKLSFANHAKGPSKTEGENQTSIASWEGPATAAGKRSLHRCNPYRLCKEWYIDKALEDCADSQLNAREKLVPAPSKVHVVRELIFAYGPSIIEGFGGIRAARSEARNSAGANCRRAWMSERLSRAKNRHSAAGLVRTSLIMQSGNSARPDFFLHGNNQAFMLWFKREFSVGSS
jgi:hypothetical protein